MKAVFLALALAAVTHAYTLHRDTELRQFVRALVEVADAIDNDAADKEAPAAAKDETQPPAKDEAQPPVKGDAPADQKPEKEDKPAEKPSGEEAELKPAEAVEANANAKKGKGPRRQKPSGDKKGKGDNSEAKGEKHMRKEPKDEDKKGPRDEDKEPKDEDKKGPRDGDKKKEEETLEEAEDEEHARLMEFMKPLEVDEYKAVMAKLIKMANEGKDKLQKTIDATQFLIDSEVEHKEKAFEKVVENYVNHEQDNRIAMNQIAGGLMYLMAKLYIGHDDFIESDICHAMKDFNIKLNDRNNDGEVLAYVDMLANAVRDDLECFKEQYNQVNTHILPGIEQEGKLSERAAADLVYSFLQELHLIRAATIRFDAKVGKAVLPLLPSKDDAPTEEENAPPAEDEDAPPAETEDAPPAETEDAPPAETEDAEVAAPPTPATETSVVEREIKNLLRMLVKKRILQKRIVY